MSPPSSSTGWADERGEELRFRRLQDTYEYDLATNTVTAFIFRGPSTNQGLGARKPALDAPWNVADEKPVARVVRRQGAGDLRADAITSCQRR